jgi:hypothetical protein
VAEVATPALIDLAIDLTKVIEELTEDDILFPICLVMLSDVLTVAVLTRDIDFIKLAVGDKVAEIVWS